MAAIVSSLLGPGLVGVECAGKGGRAVIAVSFERIHLDEQQIVTRTIEVLKEKES